MTPASDAKDERGEYKRWLHVFTIKNMSVHEHMAFPWLWEEAAATYDMCLAFWHITKFEGMSPQWIDEFWYHVNSITLPRPQNANCYGPYAMILPRMQQSACAAEMASYKRRLSSQVFKEALDNVKSTTAERYDRLFWDGLQQYLFQPSTGDCDDETQRIG